MFVLLPPLIQYVKPRIVLLIHIILYLLKGWDEQEEREKCLKYTVEGLK